MTLHRYEACPHGVPPDKCASCSIGQWYEDQRREAERLCEELRLARERGASAKEIRRLEYALELARYVGD